MLIGWGMKDFVFDRHFLDEWARRFPEAEVHRFADAGHYILEDAGGGDRPAGPVVPGARTPVAAGRSDDRRRAGRRNIAAGLPDDGPRPARTPWRSSGPAGRDRAGRARHTHWTFRQLDRESDASPRGLSAIGIGRGVRTVLMVRPSLEFFALTFALFKAGAVPVLVDPGMGVKNLGPAWPRPSPRRSSASRRLRRARRLLGWGGDRSGPS